MKKTLCFVLSFLLLFSMLPPAYASTFERRPTSQATYIDGTPIYSSPSSSRGSTPYVDSTIDGVPTGLQSNSDHYCIPCAITNIAGYYSTHGYPSFYCSTLSQQNSKAMQVQSAMSENGGSCTSNVYINQGFDSLSYTAGGTTYSLQATAYSTGSFDFFDIMKEIQSDRPLMLGFAAIGDTPYQADGTLYAHMTVCVGVLMDGNSYYVYVSDAHNDYYRLLPYSPSTYNDFVATVRIVTS